MLRLMASELSYAQAIPASPPRTSDRQVAQTINRLPGRDFSAVTPADICSYDTVKLSGLKAPALVVTTRTGRGACTALIVIETPAAYAQRDVFAANDVHKLLVPAHTGSSFALRVQKLWYANGGSTECAALWTRILGMDAHGWVDRSADYSAIYAQRLRTVESQRRAHDDICLTMEHDRILRFTGRDPMAGIATATAWLDSADYTLRLAGLAVIGQARFSARHALLEKASHDANEVVAGRAKTLITTAEQ